MELPTSEIITTTNQNGDIMGYAVDTFGENKAQAINTKEDYNIVEGLFLGNKLYEEKETVRIVGLSKIFDMI